MRLTLTVHADSVSVCLDVVVEADHSTLHASGIPVETEVLDKALVEDGRVGNGPILPFSLNLCHIRNRRG